MVEQGRAAQINNLSAQGWTHDDECRRIAWGVPLDEAGGPSFMRGPDGLYYAISCGQQRPLDGPYPVLVGPIPETMAQHIAFSKTERQTRLVNYTCGKADPSQD